MYVILGVTAEGYELELYGYAYGQVSAVRVHPPRVVAPLHLALLPVGHHRAHGAQVVLEIFHCPHAHVIQITVAAPLSCPIVRRHNRHILSDEVIVGRKLDRLVWVVLLKLLWVDIRNVTEQQGKRFE